MKWPMEKLGVVAPAKPIKKPKIADSNSVWLLNLDMVESHTGRVIEKLLCSPDEAGTSTHWFDENYVLYSKLRPYLNKVVVPDGLGLATTELVPMLPDPERLDRKYLAYYLRSEQFVRWVNEQVAGAKMPRVSMKIFWEHEIPLPTPEEQKRIVAILDKADSIRQKRQQAMALADDFLRSVFLDMFGDPVTNPKGWAVKPLGKDIIHANNGLARRRKEEDNVGDIVLRLQDVHYDGIHFDKDLNRIALDKKEKERYQVDIGDILFVRVNGNPNYVGRSTVFNGHVEDVYHNDHIIRIKVSSSFEPKFLSYVFNSNGGRKIIAKKTKTSAGQHTISQAGIEELEIYRPPLEKQKSFVKIMNALMPMIENNFKSGGLNVGLFAVLSQKAFSGQL